MAVTIANVTRNHRGLYFEATGDGAATALVVNHLNGVHANTTATATVLTAPSGFYPGTSGKGGFIYPTSGTAVTVSSVSVTSTAVTVNTSVAAANGTKAYVSVVFDQTNSAN
jgi:hypothetical protein